MRRLPWLVLVPTLAACAAAVPVGDVRSEDIGVALVLGVFVVVFAGVGALVASRLPASPLGWIMLAAGVGFALIVLGDSWGQPYVENPSDGRPGSVAALWFGSWGWVLPVGLAATLLLLLFPTGRPPSRRWRPLVWAACVLVPLSCVGVALEPGPLEGYGNVENPVGVEGAGALAGGALMLLALTAVACVASLFVRYRRAGLTERQQLKWLLWAAGLVALVIVAIAGSGLAGLEPSDNLVNGGMTGALVAVPVAVGIAILRHGLFDIDVVINRTLVYGALTATLALAYLGAVLLLQVALSPVTEESDLAIAGSTLAVAALARPARLRIQHAVDRRFYRRHYDAALTLQQFGSRVRDEVALDSLSAELRTVVADTMQPAHVSLWLRGARG